MKPSEAKQSKANQNQIMSRPMDYREDRVGVGGRWETFRTVEWGLRWGLPPSFEALK